MFPRSAKLTSKERSNYNNVTLGAGAESFWSKSYMITTIQNFTLVSLTSTTIPHPVGLSFRAMVLSHLTHSTTYSTPHCLRSWKVFPTVGTIFASPICWGIRLSFLERHWIAWSLSGRLDAIELAFHLCRRQLCHRYWSELLAKWRELTFGMSLVLVKIAG